jgi:Fe-S cluster assembly protein SufD
MVAVERLVEAYRAFAANGASGAPAWLKELRDGGIARFGELGFPTTKQEAWRFTSVAGLTETAFELAHPASRVPHLDSIQPFLLGDGPRLVFVNGFLARSLSTPVSDGVRLDGLAQALVDTPDLVRQHLSKYAGFADRPFAALNTAFVRDGAFVYVPAKVTIEEPIQLLFLATPSNDGARLVAHPRNLIVIEREARAIVVETYAALGDGVYWTNAVTEVVAGDGARVDCYRVQRESDRAYHVAVTDVHQGRDSTVT